MEPITTGSKWKQHASTSHLDVVQPDSFGQSCFALLTVVIIFSVPLFLGPWQSRGAQRVFPPQPSLKWSNDQRCRWGALFPTLSFPLFVVRLVTQKVNLLFQVLWTSKVHFASDLFIISRCDFQSEWTNSELLAEFRHSQGPNSVGPKQCGFPFNQPSELKAVDTRDLDCPRIIFSN